MRRRFARQPFLLSQQQPASSKHKVKPTRAFLSAVAKLSFKMPKTSKVTPRVYGGAALVAATFLVPAPPAGASAHVRTAVADYNKLANAIEVNKKSEDGKLREALREATKSPGPHLPLALQLAARRPPLAVMRLGRLPFHRAGRCASRELSEGFTTST